jgi:hypothetical protein
MSTTLVPGVSVLLLALFLVSRCMTLIKQNNNSIKPLRIICAAHWQRVHSVYSVRFCFHHKCTNALFVPIGLFSVSVLRRFQFRFPFQSHSSRRNNELTWCVSVKFQVFPYSLDIVVWRVEWGTQFAWVMPHDKLVSKVGLFLLGSRSLWSSGDHVWFYIPYKQNVKVNLPADSTWSGLLS